MRSVGQFNSLASHREYHMVFADDIAASDCVQTDLPLLALTHQSLTTVHNLRLRLARFDGLKQRISCARGRIDFLVMVHFDDFDVRFASKARARALNQIQKQR
jgi:hypothetical protein